MTRWLKTIGAMGMFGWLLATGITVQAQEYIPVEVKDLKDSPQRFWARGIVFRDVLQELPGTRTLRLNDRTITRFALKELGEVYAFEDLVARSSSLPLGAEYLFSGTVIQRGRNYLFVIKDISSINTNSASIPDQLATINRGLSTNVYNRVFAALEGIMAEIQNELFAYATSQNISMETVFDVSAGHMQKVTSSIHTALRRAEERSKMPAQEYLVSLIVAMMAMQNGYVETAPKPYVPEMKPAETPTAPMEITNEISESSWDQSTIQEIAPVVTPEITIEPEVVVEQPVVDEQPVDVAVEPSVIEPVMDAEQKTEAPEPAVEVDEVMVPDEQTETDPEPVVIEQTEPVVEASKTAVEMMNEVLAGETAPEVPAVTNDVTESVPVEAEPAAEPVLNPLDDPFWADPVMSETPDEVTEPTTLDVSVSSGINTVVEPVATSEPAPTPAVVEQMTPETSPTMEAEIPVVDEPVVEEKPVKKEKTKKKKKAKPAPEVVVPAEEPVASQDEIDYSKPLPLR